MQHDYQKMSIKTRPLNLCMFNPNKKMVMLTFYTCVDSLTESSNTKKGDTSMA